MLRPRDRLLRLLATVLYLGFAFLLSFVMGTKRSDLDVFFWPAAELAAHGHPLLAYSVHAGPYPNANGPLALVPLTLVAVLANSLGWASDPPLRDGLTLVAFSAFTLLSAREAAGLIRRAGLNGRNAAVYAGFCFSIPLWLALGSFGHVEIPLELWLTLVAVRLALRGRVVVTGVILGLVLLTRSSAAVLVLAVALLLAADGPHAPMSRRYLRPLVVLGVALTTTIAGLAPFLLSNAHAVISSLVGFRGSLPISGGSLWVVFARGLPWSGFVQHYDVLLILVAAGILTGILVSRTPGPRVGVRGVALALTVAACCVPLLSKTTWSYYLAEPYAFAIVALAARPGQLTPLRWAIPALLAIVSLALAVAGLSNPPTPAEMAVGVAASMTIALAVLVLIRDAAGGHPTSATVGVPASAGEDPGMGREVIPR